LFFQGALFASIPVIDPAAPAPENPSDDHAAMIVILSAWNPSLSEYKELAPDPRICIEEFNIMACLQARSGGSMKDMWRWRKLRLSWQEIADKLKIPLDDLIPRADKKWPEPYIKCWSYWRERGGVKNSLVVTDYDFEKLVEVLAIQKVTAKAPDVIIDLLQKGETFRTLSKSHLTEKTPKAKKGKG